MIPRGTYRIQLGSDFDFDDAGSIVDYLSDLGVSHLYCSPYLQAAPGSTHGYDVVDPRVVSEGLGGTEGLARLTTALEGAGMGQVMDIVPNHMAAHPANPWWWDVLRRGPASPHASFFDIQWDQGGGTSDLTVLVPILDDHYGRVLEAGEIELRREDDEIVVTYRDHRLPVSPETTRELIETALQSKGVEPRPRERPARDDIGPTVDAVLRTMSQDPDTLDALLSDQNYRLAHWRIADEELDYRRFFNIETLIGLRVESERVFEETHSLIGSLAEDGIVDGIRVDHVDGLRDPGEYLTRLASIGEGLYVVVEKILEQDEMLPGDWPVAGTTGYEFLNRVNRLYVDSEAESAFSNLYRSFTGEAATYDEVVHASKRQIMETQLAVEMQRLTGLLSGICDGYRRHRDHTRRDLREALSEVVANFGVYRIYTRPGTAATAADRGHVRRALNATVARRPDLDEELIELIGRLALGLGEGDAEAEFCRRFQQLTAPVMAKGVEDTAFYRYNRFISLNEVGGDPGTFGSSATRFHHETARSAREWPHSMLTMSTHDTKRSADVRARLNVLSELAVEWRQAVETWASHNERHRHGPWPERNAEYLLYQTLVGAWPIEADRVAAFMAKAVKEAKTHTSWTDPNQDYDESTERFTRSVLGDPDFVESLRRFLGEHRIVERGRSNSVSQHVLLLTAPGVPDIYQGTESWDYSLVDPDNRRPVDYDERRRMLRLIDNADLNVARQSQDGLKLWVTQRLLRHRRENRDLYEAVGYEPIDLSGPPSGRLVGFRREHMAVLVKTGTDADWSGTTVRIPAGRWANVLDDSVHEGGGVPIRALLGDLPAAVMVREGR